MCVVSMYPSGKIKKLHSCLFCEQYRHENIIFSNQHRFSVDTRAPADSKPKNEIISIVMIFLLRTCLVYLY